jgi:hypothetical protein
MSVGTILFLKKRKSTDYLQASECKRGRIGGVRIRARVVTLLDLWKATCGGLDHVDPTIAIMKRPLKAFADSMRGVVIYRKK